MSQANFPLGKCLKFKGHIDRANGSSFRESTVFSTFKDGLVSKEYPCPIPTCS